MDEITSRINTYMRAIQNRNCAIADMKEQNRSDKRAIAALMRHSKRQVVKLFPTPDLRPRGLNGNFRRCKAQVRERQCAKWTRWEDDLCTHHAKEAHGD